MDWTKSVKTTKNLSLKNSWYVLTRFNCITVCDNVIFAWSSCGVNSVLVDFLHSERDSKYLSQIKEQNVRERASHEWHQDRKDGRMGLIVRGQQKEPRYKVAYHMYLASGRRLSYTPSIEHVIHAKRSLLVRQIFAIFWLHHAHVRKDTRVSSLFHTASDGKLGGAWERG